MRSLGLVRVSPVLGVVLLALAATPLVSVAALPDGLVAYWNFDSGFQAAAGGSSFNAVQHNGVTIDAAGRFGSAARFTRSLSQYLDVSAPVITQGQDHTYSVWYRSTVADIAGTDRYFVLETRDAAYNNAYSASYGLRDDGEGDIGQVFTERPNGTSGAAYAPGAAGTGWHNIIVTYDADNTGAEHAIYLDGVLVRTLASGNPLMDTAGLIIGGHRARTGRNWDGWIDDVAFWNRVITAEEIAALQNAPVFQFTDIGAGLPGVYLGSSAWGDFDNDGDLDILLTGDTGSQVISRIYRNDNGAFAEILAELPGVSHGSVAAGDFDNDGDLDILLTGDTGSQVISHIYRNDDGAFAEILAELPGVSNGSAAWGDFDNDGDLDILLTGDTGSQYVSRVYRNDGGTFGDILAELPGVSNGSAAWGDFDNDGDLDILLTGNTGSIRISRIYRNDSGTFSLLEGTPFPGVAEGSVAWGDFDDDGDLDILLTGYDGAAGYFSQVYRNEGNGTFTYVTLLLGVSQGSVAWGDYDNDGYLDVLLSGFDGICQVIHNDGGSAFTLATWLPGVSNSSVGWGDYDNDGDLDILLTGYSSGTGPITRVLRNNGGRVNAQPTAPGGLMAFRTGDRVILRWDAATDAETPVAGLSYNLRIGTTPGGSQIMSAMVDGASGYRRLPALGNVQQKRLWAVNLPTETGRYYWSVQAVDAAWAGSPMAPEAAFPDTGLFTDIEAGLTGVRNGGAVWGDYDNDGDLDILLAGIAWNLPGRPMVSTVYRNDLGTYTDIVAGLPGVYWASMAWGDYDNDGDLDFVIGGENSSREIISRIYRNDAGAFTDIGAALPGATDGSVAWGDYDNDGDLDLLMTGLDSSNTYFARIYRNDAGTFADIGAGLPGVILGRVAWGDYDNDGDLDILLAGVASSKVSIIYRNDAGAFTDIGAGLPGACGGAVAWGDYDNDGDLDLVITGTEGGSSPIYRNDAGTFTDIGAGLPWMEGAAAAWGDYDNDGDLDLLLSGPTIEDGVSINISRIYRNDAGTFTDIEAGLPGVKIGSAVWGDCDNDGDLDILLTGYVPVSGMLHSISRIYRNDGARFNSPPDAPTSLGVDFNGPPLRATLSWNPASDSETPTSSLTYNLRIGSTPGGSEICTAMAGETDGHRRIVQSGNCQHRTSWTVRLREPGHYYWSVQAVDGALAGSPFAAEQEFDALVDNAFVDAEAGLVGVAATATWGDYDNDGDLDVLLVGDSEAGYVSRVYNNDSGLLRNDEAVVLPGLAGGSAAWGDYDNDGDLDILLTGDTGSAPVSRVYRNDAGIFNEEVAAALPGVAIGSGVWGDYDADGDLDILLTGDSGSGYLASVYRNDRGGAFVDVGAGLTGVAHGSAIWGDYDNDGDLDVLLIGDSGSGYVALVYRNDGGATFTDIGAGLPGVFDGSASWGDYDSDGDLDILLTGDSGSGYVASVYRNDGGATFTDISAGLPGVFGGSASWGDYDNDGDLDILLTGDSGSGYVADVFRNNGDGSFAGAGAGLQPMTGGSVAWGDYDADGDQDILMSGYVGAGSRFSGVYRNDSSWTNTRPAAPSNLAVHWTGATATLSWGRGFDQETPTAGLSYNLRIGTTPGGNELTSAMSDATTGYRRVVEPGNRQHQTSWSAPLPGHQCYWSAQTVDAAGAGSVFAPEQEFRRVSFSDIGAHLRGASCLAWGDYDNDGDLDILLAGGDYYSGKSASICRNDGGGTFTDVGVSLPGDHAVWGDYDNDGDFDLAVIGHEDGSVSRIYRNDGGAFTDIVAGLPGVVLGSMAWGDYDNDGDLDLLITGIDAASIPFDDVVSITRIYRNDAGAFTDIAAGLRGTWEGSAAWGDYDNDGDLDILLTGKTKPTNSPTTLIYANAGGTFTEIGGGLPGATRAAWGDYDNDGDLDILLYGDSVQTRVLRNEDGTFTDIYANLPLSRLPFSRRSASWGDFDNDGDLDILLTCDVYRNDNGLFAPYTESGELPNLDLAGAWGDFDNDGDLDILLAGGGATYVLRSDWGFLNTPPTSPTGLCAAVVGNRVQLTWSASTDALTPSQGLTYNLRVGTTPGGSEILTASADRATGYRRLAQMGNVQHRRWWTLQLPRGQYYWSVQAVDGAFAGSPFASEGAFAVGEERPDLRIDPSDLSAAAVPGEGVLLTAIVRNAGYGPSPATLVRFSNPRNQTPIGADQVIAPLAPGASDTCTAPWTAECNHDRFRAQVDPDGAIVEVYDRNNSAELVYGDSLGIQSCYPVKITAVTAAYGRLSKPNHFGKYLRGIKGSREEFTAALADPDALATRLSFVVGHRDTVWVGGADDWTYGDLDPGSLGSNDTLRVKAFDGQRPVSAEYVGVLETRAMPGWLSKWFDLGTGPIALETKDGLPYFTFTLNLAVAPKDTTEAEPDSLTLVTAAKSLIEFKDIIDGNIPIVGGKDSEFKLDVNLKVWCPLLEGHSWLAEGSMKKEAKVFGRDNTEEVGVKVWLSESGVDSLRLDPPYKNTLHLWKSPEIKSPPYYVAGLEVVFGVAMDLFLHAQIDAFAQDNFDSLLVVFTPSLEADIDVTGTVSIPKLKFAKVQVIVNPNLELGPVVTYARGLNIGNDFDLGGFFQFTLNGRVVASITYKVWKYKKTESWTVATFPTYRWRKDFHLAGKPGSGLMALAGEADTSYVDTTTVYVPDVFPYPNAASDTSGTVGFVWIQDVDPDPDLAQPQVYYAEKAPEEADWSSEPVTTDDLFKSYATFAYLPGGDPIAVWVQASNTEGETDTTWTLSDILDRQDLWFAARDSGGSWTSVPVFTEAEGVHRADGVPAIAPTASGAALAWVRRAASADSALAPGSGEIYVASYASGSWSTPLALTDDAVDDTSPAICSAGGDTAVVLWVREDTVALQPNELVWSKGTGNAWQSPAVLSGGMSSWTKQPPSVTKAEDGRMLATWVETEQVTVPVDDVNTQIKVVYHLRASTLAAGETVWSPIEEVFVDSSFVECPVALIDRRNIGAITWRGYNGMDGDLWISLRDLDKAGSTWTLPRCIAPDNLTDWMATATLDANNNLYVIDQQSNLSQPPEPPFEGKALFPGGLRLRTKGISNALDLTDLPNRGFRPLTGDLTLGVDSVWVQGATPTVGETDTIAAYVKNIGDYEIAAGGLVRFYQGHPDSIGSFALVPDTVLPAMAPDDSVQVKAPWPVAAGTHRLYAVVDPDEVVAEQDDNNNTAYLAVSIVPDLAVDSLRVSDPNPEPGDEVTLRAYVRNVGASPAQDYSVRFGKGYSVSHDMLAVTLGTLTGLTLAPGDGATLEMPFTAARGVDTLCAAVYDPDSLLADPDSTNNRAWEPLRVLPDLAVWIDLRDDVPDSIRFSEGFEESLSVTIANVGGVDLDPGDAVKVRILSGNPRAGGVPLLADITWPIAFPPGFPVGAQDSMLVAWSDLDPVLDSLGISLDMDGVPIEPIAIFAVVDPEGTIEERSTLNNEDFLSIGDGLPQLTMLDGSIAIRPVDGAVDTVSAFVQNLGTTGCQAVLVEFFAGDPDTGGYLIDDRLIPRLVPGETARAWVTWDTPQENITVFAIVDRPQLIAEYNEADNRISQEFSLVVDVPTTPTVPVTLALHPAFPNPFSGSTTISFDLPKQGRVEVAVFDVTGRLVRTLLDQELPPGRQTLEWDGRSNTQRATATGIYFVRLRAGEETLTRKIVRLK